jgi:hypothetical protein
MQQPPQQKELDDRESLRNLDGIYVDVSVGKIPPTASKEITEDRLKAEVERQLERGKVHLLEMGHFRTGDPHIEVVISVSEVQNRIVASRVELNFVQICFMRRNPAVTFNRARTWYAEAVTSLGPAARLGERVRRDLARQVDQFIAAYHTVNRL